MQPPKEQKEQKKKLNLTKLRNYAVVIVILLVIIKLNKTLFFMIVFSVLAYLGKQIRGMFGLKLVVLDPLHFSAIMMAKYIGLKEAIILVAINTLIVDMLTAIASDGTFANFFLFSGSAVLSVLLLGGTNVVIYSSVAALMYAVGYYFYRVLVPSQAPFEVVSKCITSFVFTFLYASFFGPLLGLLMSV
jgi:hypothetical protein